MPEPAAPPASPLDALLAHAGDCADPAVSRWLSALAAGEAAAGGPAAGESDSPAARAAAR